MNKPVILGKFGATHGVQGWIKVYSFTTPPENLLSHPTWQVNQRGQPKTYKVLANKLQNNHYLVKIEGINSPEQAQELVNCVIHTERSALPSPEPGEYYWSDLEGLTVITPGKITLGKVDHLFSTGANDILCVVDEKMRERLIPYIKDVIIDVNLEKQQIIAEWDPDF